MIFPAAVIFNEEEKLILKVILSGVSIRQLQVLLPQYLSPINDLIESIYFKMVDPFRNDLEVYLNEYAALVAEKHSAVKEREI